MKFRHWCWEKWQEHRDEVRSWEGFYPTATGQEYFNKYKWWLRREYQATVIKELQRQQLDLQTKIVLDLH
jgi:hypothetical protein